MIKGAKRRYGKRVQSDYPGFFSSTLKGAEYGCIAEQLKLHASEELAHALEVARQMDYLANLHFRSIKGYYRMETKSRNRSERRPRITMIIDKLSIN